MNQWVYSSSASSDALQRGGPGTTDSALSLERQGMGRFADGWPPLRRAIERRLNPLEFKATA